MALSSATTGFSSCRAEETSSEIRNTESGMKHATHIHKQGLALTGRNTTGPPSRAAPW